MKGRVYLVLFLTILMLGVTVFVCSEVLRIHEVVVIGCEERDPAEVVNLAQVKNEESVFRLKFKEISARVDADPYFDVKSVRYVFPDKLRIEVEERKVSAAIAYGNRILLVDETGFVLEIRTDPSGITVPMVEGLRIVEGLHIVEEEEREIKVEVCATLVSSLNAQMDALHVILAQLRAQNVLHLIETINLDAVSDLWMTTVSGFEVRLGNFEKMQEKIRWLRAVEPILASEGYTGGILTVSAGDHASFLDQSGATQALPLPTAPQETPETEESEETPPEEE